MIVIDVKNIISGVVFGTLLLGVFILAVLL